MYSETKGTAFYDFRIMQDTILHGLAMLVDRGNFNGTARSWWSRRTPSASGWTGQPSTQGGLNVFDEGSPPYIVSGGHGVEPRKKGESV